MRKDLNKVLVERERRGSEDSYSSARRSKKFTDNDYEGQPHGNTEPMKIRYGYKTKNFSENLRPLYGLIRKNVGKNWDKFYSKLCEVFDMKSVINNHILQHLYSYCSNKVYEKDDELWVHGSGYHGDYPLNGSNIQYFIHPKTKIITKNKHYKTYREVNRKRDEERSKELFKTERRLDDGRLVRKINDVWYFITVEIKDDSFVNFNNKFIEKTVEVITKVQLNSDEIRKYCL